MASKPDPEPLAASPKWTRPSDVMKLRQLKRRIKTPGSSSSSAKASPSISSAIHNAASAATASAIGGRRRFDGVFGSKEKENDLDRGDDDEDDDDDDDDDNDSTPSKRQKKNPFSVSPRRKLNLSNKASSSSSSSSSSKDSLLAAFGISKRLTKTAKSKVNSLKSEDEPLARPIDGSCLSIANPSSPQQQQQQQQSFLDLISSISDESVDNTELFQKLSSQRQRSSRATLVLGGAAAATAVASGHAAAASGHAAAEDVNSSVVTSGNQSAPSSANSSFNLSNLNLSSATSSPSTSSVGFGISSQDAEIAPDKLIVSPFLPVDWSLKTRIRLQADAPWPWQGTLKTMDEADGVAAFMRGDSLGETSSSSSGASSSSSSPSSSSPSWHAQIQSSTLTWIFPSIPGLPSFPRFGSNLKNVEAHPLTTQQSVVHALQQDFASAFTSVFNQLKGSRCPYFYVCTQRFTVLFRTEGLGGCEEINVQIAPTSKGLRDGLNSEGIEYAMPLGLKRRSATTSSSSSVNHFGGIGGDSATTSSTVSASASSTNVEEDIEAEEDLESTAASNWLESMGIDKSKFPTLNPQRVSLAADNYKVVDGRPQSLVKIQGLGDVQAFFNFLLNNDHLTTSSSGSQAGVPPTILSPVSYKGATLRQLRYTHGTMRYKSTRASQILHTLDVMGPILPHHLLNIAAIASNTPVNSFNISCTNQESTFTFNHRQANNTSAATANTSGAELQMSNSHSSSSSSKLSPEVEALLLKTGLRKEAVAEMGLNRMKDKSGIRESYYEEDSAFTSVLQ